MHPIFGPNKMPPPVQLNVFDLEFEIISIIHTHAYTRDQYKNIFLG